MAKFRFRNSALGGIVKVKVLLWQLGSEENDLQSSASTIMLFRGLSSRSSASATALVGIVMVKVRFHISAQKGMSS